MNQQLDEEIHGVKEFCLPVVWGLARRNVQVFWFPNREALRNKALLALLINITPHLPLEGKLREGRDDILLYCSTPGPSA